MKSFNKVAIALLTCLFASPVFAELNKPSRHVEISVENTTSVANSYFGIEDFFTENLVIDLSKIARDIPDDGFRISLNEQAQADLKLNFGRTFRLDLFAGAEAFGTMNISKELFKMLSSFNKDQYAVSSKGSLQAFAVSGAKFQTFINGYGITVKPTLFVPVVYCPEAKAEVAYKDDGEKITFGADVTAKVYSSLSGEELFGDEDLDDFGSMSGGTGFSMELEVEYPITKTLDIGAFTNVPIVAGKLDYCTEMGYTVSGYLNNPLSKTKDGEDRYDTNNEKKDNVYSSDSITLHRPFKFGVKGAWRPLGKWFTLRPEIGFAVRSPFSDYAETYLEYSLSSEFSLFNIVGLNLTSNYKNQIFSQQLGFMFNLYAVEIDLAVASSATEFGPSWKLGGTTVYAGVKIGL